MLAAFLAILIYLVLFGLVPSPHPESHPHFVHVSEGGHAVCSLELRTHSEEPFQSPDGAARGGGRGSGGVRNKQHKMYQMLPSV